MKIRDYVKLHNEQEPLVMDAFLSPSLLDTTESEEYEEQFGFDKYPCFTSDFQKNFTQYMKLHHGKKSIYEDIADEDSTYVEIAANVREICDDLFITNKYKYSTLFQTISQVYNPIENWYKIESESGTQNQGSQSNSQTKGQQINTNQYGQVQTTDVIGSKNTTDSGYDNRTLGYGERVNEDDYAKTKQTNSFGKITTTDEDAKAQVQVSDSVGQITETDKKVALKTTEKDKKAPVKVTDNIAELTVTDNIAQVTTNETDKKAPMVTEDVFASQHKCNDEVTSNGSSAYDNAGEFGSVGIQTEQGTGMYKLQPNTVETPNGDSNFNPKERTYHENVENIAGKTDTHTVSQDRTNDTNGDVKNTTVTQAEGGDVHTTSTHIDTHTTEQDRTNDVDGDVKETVVEQVLGTGENGDTHITSTHTDTHTTSQILGESGSLTEHGDYHKQEIEHNTNDTVENDAHKDTHTINKNGVTDTNNLSYSHTIGEGQQQNTSTIAQRSDTLTDGQRIDSESIGAREDRYSRSYSGHGNVNMTTSQQMIKEQRDVAGINLYEIIAHDLIIQMAYVVYDDEE